MDHILDSIMRYRITNKAAQTMNIIKVLSVILVEALLLSGCVRDETETLSRPGAEGQKVMIALEVHIPKAESPVIKPIAAAKPGAKFSVCSEVAPDTRSDGTSKLYNLWLFQFDAAGNINGVPHKISDEVTAINDMVLIDVPLIVAKNQTLCLLALGRQVEANMNAITTFAQVEALSFTYTVAKDGLIRSKITSDDDMPFVGYIKGANVVAVETGENRGQVEYNTPDGFAGGISIRRLLSRITLKYKFEAPGYELDGLRLTNVNSMIRITNPEKNNDTDTYVTLDGEKSSTPDANGYYTATWFVAQNHQGTVSTITTESDRYYSADVKGPAPAKATNIEAWAFSTVNPNFYAVYQMYVGKNNTSNFDISANTQYNLRTTINTDIESAKNDNRIRAASAEQKIFLRASGYVPKSVSQGTVIVTPSPSYDLDAHYDKRPLIIYTKGRVAVVGIYTDEACTQFADKETSWLRISSSDNYTDAYHNSVEPLGTSIKTDIIQLPTQLIFYLYSNEYFSKDGDAPETTEKRRLYIKIETTNAGVAGGGAIVRNSITYYFEQRPALCIGRFGGEYKNDEYSQDIYLEDIGECGLSYSDVAAPIQQNGLPVGYYNKKIDKDPRYAGVSDPMNGRLATIQMVENPGDFEVNEAPSYLKTLDIAKPIKQNGHVMLYQYTLYNTYAARGCYDKNRDDNGNGYLDDSEIKWYLPSVYQLYAASAMNLTGFSFIRGSLTSSSVVNDNIPVVSFDTGSQGYTTLASAITSRCVRDVKPRSGVLRQARFYVHDESGKKYGAVDATSLPNAENRAENPNLYVRVPLCEYSETGNESTIKFDDKGDTIFVKRMRRHAHYIANASPTLNATVSSRFLIAPSYIDMDGNPIDGKSGTTKQRRLTWANAMGYLASANTVGPGPDRDQRAVDKGCALYRGKDGTDALGSWRLPTQREMLLISMCINSFNNAATETGSVLFYKLGLGLSALDASYWTATENPTSGNAIDMFAWYHQPFSPGVDVGYTLNDGSSGSKVKNPRLVRCIRDIPPTN